MDYRAGDDSAIELLENTHISNEAKNASTTLVTSNIRDNAAKPKRILRPSPEDEDSFPAVTSFTKNLHTRLNKRLPRALVFKNGWELFYLTLVLINVIPVILLAIYSGRLTTYLDKLACLPNGEFVLPGSDSIWNPDYILTISISLGINKSWTFSHVKFIDVVWDVVIGRGGQIILIYVSYRVFNKAIVRVMQSNPVSYGSYGAVAFQTGSFASILHFLRSWVGDRFITVGNVNFWIFAGMTLTTVYTASMPTLYSAMTGYTSLTSPWVEVPPENTTGEYLCEIWGGCAITACGGPGYIVNLGDAMFASDENGGLLAGWGVCLDSDRVEYSQHTIAEKDTTNAFRKYYEKYRADYEAAANDPRCQGLANRTDCPPLAKSSDFHNPILMVEQHLDPPLLDIQTWGTDENTGLPDTWICQDLILDTPDFNRNNITAVCLSSNEYIWGFSFLLLFIVSILQCLWATIMYALWVDASRAIEGLKTIDNDHQTVKAVVPRPSLLSNAFAIVDQAEKQLGGDVKSWTNEKLDKVVWRGNKGMSVR